jgi:hypothetical protein
LGTVFLLLIFVDVSLGQNFECFVSAEGMKQNTKVMTDSSLYLPASLSGDIEQGSRNYFERSEVVL